MLKINSRPCSTASAVFYLFVMSALVVSVGEVLACDDSPTTPVVSALLPAAPLLVPPTPVPVLLASSLGSNAEPDPLSIDDPQGVSMAIQPMITSDAQPMRTSAAQPMKTGPAQSMSVGRSEPTSDGFVEPIVDGQSQSMDTLN